MKQSTQPKKPELLIPAGSFNKLKTAIMYGADAVYLGTPDLSLRTKAEFTLEELQEGVKYAHAHGKKVYVTVNLYSHNKDVEKLPEMIDALRKVQPDGLIIADPGIFEFVKERAPELELHISTQANVCSWLTVDYWKKQGASLCVLAREVSFEELKEIRKKCPDIKLEAFIHGAMCMAQSGRCLLSNFMAERGANQGNCAHSCRWNYKVHLRLRDGTTEELIINDGNRDMFEFLLKEEFRPGSLIPIEEDELGTYIMNAKDLCLMTKLPDYLSIGIDSFKVEGRHKTEFYVAGVTRAYRKAIDDYYKNPETWTPEPYLDELFAIQNRGYTLAFHDGRLSHLAHDYERTHSLSEYEYAGLIREYEKEDMIFEIRNEICAGDLVEFLPPDGSVPARMRLQTFTDAVTGIISEKVSPGQRKAIRVPLAIFNNIEPKKISDLLPPLTVARKKKCIIDPRTSAYIQKNKTALDAETTGEKIPEQKKEPLKVNARSVGRAPHYGSEACCGKGCNGCLIFWHDKRFEGARERLKQKAIGEKLQSPR